MIDAGEASAGRPAFTEVQLLSLMVLVWIAVEIAAPSSVAAAGGAAAAGVLTRRRLLFAAALVLLASGLSHRAEESFRLAVRETIREEPATIVLDAEPGRFGWRAEARLDRTSQRVRLIGPDLVTPDLVAGERVSVSGRLGPIESTAWSKSRHLVGAVTVSSVRSVKPPAWYLRPGEWLRTGVIAASRSFPVEQQALYRGLVIGDDRLQSEGQRAQFRAAGLSHLLAVSGQNVAFLLAVSSPVLRRLPPRAELGALAALLITFAFATRLEPSVLRATATAGVSALAVARSSPSGGVRALALAVTVLLCVDPFLAGSVAFRLSVAASLGILLLAPVIRERVPGPSAVADPLAVTLGAQLGVSPLLMVEFGPVSVVTIPANLLAGWAAGAVMTLGLTIGLIAAVVPEPVSALLQLPARLLVWWIAAVAAVGSRTPLPSVGITTVPWIALVLLLVRIWQPRTRITRSAAVAVFGMILVVSAPAPAPLSGWHPSAASTPSVLVVEGSGPSADDLIAARVHDIDIVVVADGGWSAAQAVERIREVADVGVVLAPGDHRIVGGRRVVEDTTLAIDGGVVRISASPSRLRAEVITDTRE